jgi:hypothetical protein
LLKKFHEHAGTLGIIGVLVGAFVGYPTCPVSAPASVHNGHQRGCLRGIFVGGP